MESENFDIVALLQGFVDGQVYYSLDEATDGDVEIQIAPLEAEPSEGEYEPPSLGDWASTPSRVAG